MVLRREIYWLPDWLPPTCHCEEQSDEAIPAIEGGRGIAASLALLAMTVSFRWSAAGRCGTRMVRGPACMVQRQRDVLEHLHTEWKRSSRWFASNFITLIRFAIPVRVILL
jgi:hypothetical protein